MRTRALYLILALCTYHAVAAQPIWTETFDARTPTLPSDVVTQAEGRGGVAHITSKPNAGGPGRTIVLRVPMEQLRGKRVFLRGDIKASGVSEKPNSWNGVKLMMVLDTPSGRTYPQAEIPAGTFDWRRFSTSIAVPESATNALIVLGLENVSGEAWFDNVALVPGAQFKSTRKVDPLQPVFRGHDLPRLRGAMAGNSLTEDDVRYFAETWKGNLLRIQIFEAARKDRALEDYDTWLGERLRYVDNVLTWCERFKVKAVVDLHSPPGGQAFSAGYITARGRIFSDPAAQTKFIQVWEQMARRYKGREIIWGFDLVNEPDDSNLGEDCLDWNSLADKAGQAVHAIDPSRTLIIEPNGWGGPDGFSTFEPLDLPNVVYSFHFYKPMQFTHQGIHGNPAGVVYPGRIANDQWNKNALEKAMQAAIDFARKHRVHMYVGEFSAIRSAPAGSAAKYLSDLIEVFEKHGFDWSYHAYREWQGWSLEHEGPLDKPVKAQSPTDRQQVVTGWFARSAAIAR